MRKSCNFAAHRPDTPNLSCILEGERRRILDCWQRQWVRSTWDQESGYYRSGCLRVQGRANWRDKRCRNARRHRCQRSVKDHQGLTSQLSSQVSSTWRENLRKCNERVLCPFPTRNIGAWLCLNFKNTQIILINSNTIIISFLVPSLASDPCSMPSLCFLYNLLDNFIINFNF